MPSLTPVCLSKSRIQGADEVAKGLPIPALHIAFLGTGEHPGVLSGIPEQGTLAMRPLTLCAPQGSAERAHKDPLMHSCYRRLNRTLKIKL
jgi:hypothetical protein